MHNHDHMHDAMGGALVAPEWLILSLSALFALGAAFYLYRLFFRDQVRAATGYSDWENEVGHGLCMLAMAGAMAPAALQAPPMVWVVSLCAAGAWFIVRALTWGKTLTYNKAWYDWVHVGMLFGMALMFVHVNLGLIFTALLLAFWGWFTSYYAYQVFLDLKNPKVFSLGADFAHFAMGLVMFLMTLFPSMLMPMHGQHGGHMHHDHTQVIETIDDSAICKSGGNVSLADDSSFDAYLSATAASSGPVFVMFQGKCDKCAAEVPVFQEVADKYQGNANFVRLRLADSPEVADRYGVTECPCILCIKNGALAQNRLTDSAEAVDIEAFVKANL